MSARGLAAIALSAVVLAVPACGGDDEEEPAPLTAPAPQTTVAPAPTETTTAPAAPTTTAPGGTKPGPKPDSPANDVPPPAGSPQEQFERFCEQNPGACG